MQYTTWLDAISNGDTAIARDILMSEVNAATAERNSWDSPQYDGLKRVQQRIVLDYSRDKLMTFFGIDTLRDRYFLKDKKGNIVEDVQKFYARVATGIAHAGLTDKRETHYGYKVPYDEIVGYAQILYDAISKHWFCPATPILTNSGTTRGLPISCFLNTIGDSLAQIYSTFTENAYLAAGGGGIGTTFRNVRGLNGKLANGGRSSGTIPFLKVMDSSCLAVSQGNTRRGAAAAYLDVSHPDIEEFIEVRKPTGDQNRQCLNLHHGINVTDKFIQAVKSRSSWDLICPHNGTVEKTIDAYTLWKNILKMRVETGEPYLLFIDTVNKAVPQHHIDKGLMVQQSNLCSEIVLSTSSERTAVCCLGSLNLETYDQWKDQIENVTYIAVRALDNVLQNFIDHADPIKYAKAINSAQNERSIGLGVMGWHGWLMSHNIPFSSAPAMAWNKNIFKNIHTHAIAASIRLAQERGVCPDAKGTSFTQRNTYVMAIAPTANISIITGNATPCIEPMPGNAFLQKTLSGSFLVKNGYLDKLLTDKGCNTLEVWKSIIINKGSVLHLDQLTTKEKEVFKTAYEINQRSLVQQAADRQLYVCQAQSLNLFFSLPISGKVLSEIHMMAYDNGVKSLYYLRSESVLETDSVERKAVIKKIETQECAACQ